MSKSKFRNWINQRVTTVTILAIALLVAALVVIVWQSRGSGPRFQDIDVYYYDLNSSAANPLDRLFVEKSSLVPPIPTPASAGPKTGVSGGARAWVFACGDCSDASERFIGFLEIYSPQAKESVEASRGSNSSAELQQQQEAGHLINVPERDPKQWVPYGGETQHQLMRDLQERCNKSNKPLVQCYPPSGSSR